MINKIDIPTDSILGINYSGMHDTAIAILDHSGGVNFASSLERFSRIKGDGRSPIDLVQLLDVQKISKIAISVSEKYYPLKSRRSEFLDSGRAYDHEFDRSHGDGFYKFISDLGKLNKSIYFIPHHLAHASSSFWWSRYDNAICVVYDGGMSNEAILGGIYSAERTIGIELLESFNARNHFSVATLYAVVTALLGFKPLRHEGKLTGLAAFGVARSELVAVFNRWLADPREIDPLMAWENVYSNTLVPNLLVKENVREKIYEHISSFTKEDIAASVQFVAESQIINIFKKIRDRNGNNISLCLSGGIFSNVRLNQKIVELGFKDVFVVPAMGDDGTAVGAAWQLFFKQYKKGPIVNGSAYLGEKIQSSQLNLLGLKHQWLENDLLSKKIAQLLADGKIGAVATGKAEFGPRALGNRSILASASKKETNENLNKKLKRTEFMPFAPIVLDRFAHEYFNINDITLNSLNNMTVTVNCKPKTLEECPAIVHIDNTARPQVLSRSYNPIVYDIILAYHDLTNIGLLINTSFNIHEEPIVNNAEQAIRSFREAELDFLYLDGILIER